MRKFICLIFFCSIYFLSSFLSTFPTTENKITKVSLLQNKKISRIVINLTQPIDELPQLMSDLQTVSFDLDASYRTEKEEDKNQFSITSHGFVNKVEWQPNSTKTSFEIKREYFSPVDLTKQEKPPALIIELPKNYFEKESEDLKPGIKKHLIRTVSEHGPVVANILEIDLSNENISVKVGLPDKKKLKAKDALTNIVKREKAFAGINANYFDVKIGNPLGTLITEGTWLTGPVYDRVAVGFTENKQVLIDQVMLVGSVETRRGFRKKLVSNFEIDGLNTPASLCKKPSFFTIDWGDELELPGNNIAVVVSGDRVKKITEDSLDIPSNGYVLVGNENGILNLLKKRDRVSVKWQSIPDWEDVTEAISGGPYLVMDGQVFVDESNQHFKFAKKETYAPRSAIGIDEGGKLYLIAVDGRNNGYSVGLTLIELAELLKKLNLKEAINLDGGGSTTLVANGKVINNLSEHHERRISSALLIYYHHL